MHALEQTSNLLAKQPGGLFGSSASCRRVERQDVDHGASWRRFSGHPKEPHGGRKAARTIWPSSAGARARFLRSARISFVWPGLASLRAAQRPSFSPFLVDWSAQREKCRIFVLTGVCFNCHLSLQPFLEAAIKLNASARQRVWKDCRMVRLYDTETPKAAASSVHRPRRRAHGLLA